MDSMSAPVKIGLFGGTFDPPHIGHLVAASVAHQSLGLHKVLMPVANLPWMKIEGNAEPMTSAAIRLRMLKAAVCGDSRFEVSDLEILRSGMTFTIDTVRSLKVEPIELYLVVGTDVAKTLPSWHGVDELSELVTVAIAARPGAEIPVLDKKWNTVVIDMPRLDISSSEIRERIKNGQGVDYLVRPGVKEIIDEQGLYR